MPAAYVVDTHVLIWYFIGSDRLPHRLRSLIDETRNAGGQLLIPTIALAEGLDIAEKGRVQFDFDEMCIQIRNDESFEITGFNDEIFEETRQIDNVQEIHDRIIVATARYFGTGIMTKDRLIRRSGDVETFG